MITSFIYQRILPGLITLVFPGIIVSGLTGSAAVAQAARFVVPANAAHGPAAEQLARKAEVIAIGTVAELRSGWNEKHSRIYTDVILSVNEYMKGIQTAKTITIRCPGGEVGDVGELYSGTASFRTAEEVMVFASKGTSENYHVVGGNQGKFSIATDKMTGAKVVEGGVPLEVLKGRVKNAIVKSLEH